MSIQETEDSANINPKEIQNDNEDNNSNNNNNHFSLSEFMKLKPAAKAYHTVGSTAPQYPSLLALFRISCASYLTLLYAVFIWWYANTVTPEEFGKFFFFLTNLGVFALIVYFVLAGIQSILYLRNPSEYFFARIQFKTNPDGTLNPEELSLFTDRALQFLYSVALAVNSFIATLYWALVFWTHEPEFVNDLKFHGWFLNVSVHGLNYCFALTDFVLNRNTIHLVRHFLIFVAISIVYVFWVYLGSYLYSTPEQAWFVYPMFCKTTTALQRALLFIIITYISLLFYVFMHYIHAMKEKYWPIAEAYDYQFYMKCKKLKYQKENHAGVWENHLFAATTTATAAATSSSVHVALDDPNLMYPKSSSESPC